ncbi:hypothetical protein TGAMA5MH_00245 [Trichoderma gamsii]|uniref:Uncharacterized protein n=1 Tax=Trichoderma gamsii TaxID=398673 RepID=A0A2K0TTH4_9HYPO|nr:hypothetical protein TGAMA5MH_00245 [Trichoderma gamsii]
MPLENGGNHISLGKEAISSSGDEVGSQEVIRTVNTARANKMTKPVQGLDPQTKLSLIADKISRKIQKYHDDLDGTRALNVDYAISHCLCPRVCGQSFDGYLDQIEEKLESVMNDSKDKMIVWLNWFYCSCLRLVRERRRSGPRHMPSTGAKLTNIIVDRLLISDGLAALGVYNAVAECCYKLRKPSELSFQDIEHVGSLVAEKLHGRIHIPSPCSQVPLPMVWLSGLFPTVPCRDICYDIGLLQPLWLGVKPQLHLVYGDAVLVMGLTMIQFKEIWDTTVSESQALREPTTFDLPEAAAISSQDSIYELDDALFSYD